MRSATQTFLNTASSQTNGDTFLQQKHLVSFSSTWEHRCSLFIPRKCSSCCSRALCSDAWMFSAGTYTSGGARLGPQAWQLWKGLLGSWPWSQTHSKCLGMSGVLPVTLQLVRTRARGWHRQHSRDGPERERHPQEWPGELLEWTGGSFNPASFCLWQERSRWGLTIWEAWLSQGK